MPFPNEHAARQESPNKYNRFRRGVPDGFPAGVSVIYGIPVYGGAEIQSIRFLNEKWSPAEAKEWLKEHDFKYSDFEEAAQIVEKAADSSQLTREYLEEALNKAKELLPGWAYAMVHRAALPKAGARGRSRNDEPGLLHKLAIAGIRPGPLKDATDEELLSAWDELRKWHTSLNRRNRPVDDLILGGTHLLAEMQERGLDAIAGPLLADIEATQGQATMKELLIKKTHGPDRPLIAFVGASPSHLEEARGELLIGPEGETFNKLYLQPLGLTRDEVLLTKAVPLNLTDETGSPRLPTTDEIQKWKPQLLSLLADRKPWITIALGKCAKEALGERANFCLPYPTAVRKRDSGEVSRKLKTIRKALSQAEKNRTEQLKQEWDENWPELLPTDWCGVFKAADGEITFSNMNSFCSKAKTNKAERDFGGYELGVAKEDCIEVFLDGKVLKGRYFIVRDDAQARGSDIAWQIEMPLDQTPLAEGQNLADVISETKRKGQHHLLWSKPGEQPKRINVQNGKIEKALQIPILKADSAKRIVYGAVLDPYQIDSEGDWVPPGTIEDTAHAWFCNSRVIGYRHKELADAKPVESWIVQYPSEADYKKALAGEPHRVYRMPFGNDVIHSGTWMVGTKLGPKEWAEYQNGDLDAYSIGGYGDRTTASKTVMPEVEFIDFT